MADDWFTNSNWFDNLYWFTNTSTTTTTKTILEQIIARNETMPRNSIFNAGVAEPGVGEYTTLLRNKLK